MTQRSRSATAMAAAAVIVVMLVSVMALVAQQRPVAQTSPPQLAAGSPDALLGQALHQEEVEGRLTDAIATYGRVLKAAGVTKAQGARAQFRIGACYERLGLSEARRAYEAVIANYSDQVDLAAQAKARLAALADPAGRANSGGPVLRQIWATSEGVTWNRISPDGRSVAGVDDETGDLVVRSLATGTTRRLTAIPKDRWKEDGADSPVWSRDGRYVAYGWYSGEKPYEFRIADVADATSRIVPMDSRFRLSSPEDWSPDGRRVLAIVEDALPTTRRLHLAWVTTSGGAVQLLASASTRERLGGEALLAPDGAWIVFRILEEDTGVSIMAAGGGPPRMLIPVASSDSLVGWSSDGTHVLFISRERGSDGLMVVRVMNGQAVGQPILIRALPEFSSLGVSQAGALLYQSRREPRLNLYRASFDATSGRVDPPSRVDVSTGQLNGSVSWSPDGRRLAYVSWANGKPSRTLSIWSAEHAQTRSFSLPFSAFRWGWTATTWSADGRWVYAAGQDDASWLGVYRVNAESGTVEAVLPPASGVFGTGRISNTYVVPIGWSPDGRVVYKSVMSFLETGALGPGAIVEHRVADHAERELLKSGTTGTKLSGFNVSPDGSQLAFTLVDYTARKITVMVVPAAGGPAKTLTTFPTTAEGVVRWTADSRSVIFASRSDGQQERLLCDATTGVVTKLTLASEDVQEITLSPDGKEIAYIGGPKAKDEGVWMLENFLPPKQGKAIPPKK
ncbi:MAG: tetratricopeptide repeat protein [Acidobacteria bacterium]|nr:tetratricopeptide repeat protein [Acidobacteriota bacterium]